MIVWIVGGVLGTIVIVAFVCLLSLSDLRIPRQLSSRNRERVSDEEGWLSKNWQPVLQIVGGVIGGHCLLIYFWPEWWNVITGNWVLFLIDHLGVGLVFLLFREEKKTRTGAAKELSMIGTIILLILGAGNLYVMYQWKLRQIGDRLFPQAQAVDSRGGRRDSSPMAPLAPIEDVQGERETREFLEKKEIPKAQVDELLRIAQRASGFNQFESDGITPRRGRLNPKDTGRFQINSGWWAKVVLLPATPESIRTLDIRKTNDNMEAALYLYQGYGAASWDMASGSRFNENTVAVTAPVVDWGEAVDVTGRSFEIRYNGKVFVETNDGRIVQDGPGVNLHLGYVRSVKFKSREGRPVTVVLSFR